MTEIIIAYCSIIDIHELNNCNLKNNLRWNLKKLSKTIKKKKKNKFYIIHILIIQSTSTIMALCIENNTTGKTT